VYNQKGAYIYVLATLDNKHDLYVGQVGAENPGNKKPWSEVEKAPRDRFHEHIMRAKDVNYNSKGTSANKNRFYKNMNKKLQKYFMILVTYISYAKRRYTTLYERRWYLYTAPYNLNSAIPGGGIVNTPKCWLNEDRDASIMLNKLTLDQVVRVAKSARSLYSPALSLLILTKYGSQLDSKYYDRLFKSAKNKCRHKWGIRYLNKQLSIFVTDVLPALEQRLRFCILKYISSCSIPESLKQFLSMTTHIRRTGMSTLSQSLRGDKEYIKGLTLNKSREGFIPSSDSWICR